MLKKIRNDFTAATFKLLRLILAITLWSCHVWIAPAVRRCHGSDAEPLHSLNSRPRGEPRMTEGAEANRHVVLNLFQHPVGFLSAFAKRDLNKRSTPRSLDPLNPSGFTLIELIVVVIIVGILAATLLPRIDFGATSSRASVDGAAYMIASDIRYAQEFAMANRVSKSILFDTGNPSYYTFNPVSAGMDPSGQLQGAMINTMVMFTFNSLGEPATSGAWTVTVTDGVNTRTITVTQYTGKVSIS